MTAVYLTWDPTGRALTVQPVERWTPGTLHVVTVDRRCRSTCSARPLTRPARAPSFVTRPAVAGVVDATAADRRHG